MSDLLRAGVIGTGFIGGVHAHAVRAGGHVLGGVASSSLEEAEIAGAQLGAVRAFGSARELIESDDIDVVHVCTPNDLHAEIAEAAVRAGKHVVCEKPLATTVADAVRLDELAKGARKVNAVPFVYRFYPTVREIRERIGAGEAGPLWMLHGSYLQDWMADKQASNWRVDPGRGGDSRAFGDIGVHWCDLMEFVTGHRIVSVIARTARAFEHRGQPGSQREVGTEDGATVMFETDHGATGSVVVSQVTPGRKNRLWFSFDGTDASFVFDQENPDSLWIGAEHENRVVMRSPQTLAPQAARYVSVPAGHPQGYQDAFNAFIDDVYRSARGEDVTGLPTFADGRRAAHITDGVLESARTNEWVEVPA